MKMSRQFQVCAEQCRTLLFRCRGAYTETSLRLSNIAGSGHDAHVAHVYHLAPRQAVRLVPLHRRQPAGRASELCLCADLNASK